MKKFIKNCFVFAVLFCLFSTWATAQQKKVVWIGGLSESALFWNNFSSIFPLNRQMTSFNNPYGYNSTNGVRTMAADIAAYNSNLSDQTQIFIGHSLGGLALRELDKTNQANMAYITVGSPMSGAPLANSIQDGALLNAVNDGIDRVKAGPVYQFIALDLIANTRVEDLPKILNNYANYYFKFFYNAQPVLDLQPQGAYIQSIQNFAGLGPSVSIQGNEDDPVHWRLASSFLQGEGNVVEDDNNIVNVASSFYNVYNGFYIGDLITLQWYGPSQWARGKDWIRDNAGSDWAHLIGATVETTVTVPFEEYI